LGGGGKQLSRCPNNPSRDKKKSDFSVKGKEAAEKKENERSISGGISIITNVEKNSPERGDTSSSGGGGRTGSFRRTGKKAGDSGFLVPGEEKSKSPRKIGKIALKSAERSWETPL